MRWLTLIFHPYVQNKNDLKKNFSGQQSIEQKENNNNTKAQVKPHMQVLCFYANAQFTIILIQILI